MISDIFQFKTDNMKHCKKMILTGIANPKPSTLSPTIFVTTIPITSPSAFNKAPPLFPEFILTSV
jgi:hypothetical protein